MAKARCADCTPATRGAAVCEVKSFVNEKCYPTDKVRKCGAKALHKYTRNSDCSISAESYEDGQGNLITKAQYDALESIPCAEWDITHCPIVSQPPVTVTGSGVASVTQPTPGNFVVLVEQTIIPAQKDGCTLLKDAMALLPVTAPLATDEIQVFRNGACARVPLALALQDINVQSIVPTAYNAVTGTMSFTVTETDGSTFVVSYVIGPFSETPFVFNDSSTIDGTQSGTNGHTLTAVVKKSAAVGNTLQINGDGLFVPEPPCPCLPKHAYACAPISATFNDAALTGGAATRQSVTWSNIYNFATPDGTGLLGGFNGGTAASFPLAITTPLTVGKWYALDYSNCVPDSGAPFEADIVASSGVTTPILLHNIDTSIAQKKVYLFKATAATLNMTIDYPHPYKASSASVVSIYEASGVDTTVANPFVQTSYEVGSYVDGTFCANATFPKSATLPSAVSGALWLVSARHVGGGPLGASDSTTPAAGLEINDFNGGVGDCTMAHAAIVTTGSAGVTFTQHTGINYCPVWDAQRSTLIGIELLGEVSAAPSTFTQVASSNLVQALTPADCPAPCAGSVSYYAKWTTKPLLLTGTLGANSSYGVRVKVNGQVVSYSTISNDTASNVSLYDAVAGSFDYVPTLLPYGSLTAPISETVEFIKINGNPASSFTVSGGVCVEIDHA
jgi:hypothetical protein